MRIGPYTLLPPVFLAPIAGVSDRPFRRLCRRLGAGLAVSEMVSANPRLWNSDKTRLRLDHAGEPEPRSVQILGAEPRAMAEAARLAFRARVNAVKQACEQLRLARAFFERLGHEERLAA